MKKNIQKSIELFRLNNSKTLFELGILAGKKTMEKWISISAKRHKEIEIISNSKSHHKLQLDKYIFADSLELQSDELVDQIKKLNELYKSGVLSKEEFEKAKSKILNQ